MSAVVLKAGGGRPGTRGGVSLDLRDIGRQAAGQLAAAARQAEELLARARAEAEAMGREAAEIRRSAAEAGRREGHEAGRAEALEAALQEARPRIAAEARRVLEMLRAALEEVGAARERLLAESERDLLTLALAVADRVVRGAADVSPTVVLGTVRESLSSLHATSELRLRVHPDDAERVERCLPGLLPEFLRGATARVEADPGVERGGVVVESAHGSVDARLSAQVERIGEELVRDWRARGAELGLVPGATPAAGAEDGRA